MARSTSARATPFHSFTRPFLGVWGGVQAAPPWLLAEHQRPSCTSHHTLTDCRWVAPLWRSPPVRAQRQRWRLQSPGGSRNCDLAKRGTAAAPPRSRERHRPFCRGRHAGGGRPHRPKVKAPVSAGSPQRAVALLSGTLALPRKALAQHAALTGCPPSPAVVAPTARPCTVTIGAAVAVAAPAHAPGTAIALG